MTTDDTNLSYSWVNMERPVDSPWRVPEPFRDKPLTLAMLDQLVGEFDQGCMEGRRQFILFVVKACVGGDEYWDEIKRQEEVRLEQQAREERERRARARTSEMERVAAADRRYLESYREDFNQGYIPHEGCGQATCMADECVIRRAWQLWNDEQQDGDEEDEDG